MSAHTDAGGKLNWWCCFRWRHQQFSLWSTFSITRGWLTYCELLETIQKPLIYSQLNLVVKVRADCLISLMMIHRAVTWAAAVPSCPGCRQALAVSPLHPWLRSGASPTLIACKLTEIRFSTPHTLTLPESTPPHLDNDLS